MAALVVTEGVDKGAIFDLNDREEYYIGRGGTCRLSDRAASREHALLTHMNDDWVIEDSGSRHGTRVNRRMIQGPCPLAHRDRIQIGRTLLIFERDGHQHDAASGTLPARVDQRLMRLDFNSRALQVDGPAPLLRDYPPMPAPQRAFRATMAVIVTISFLMIGGAILLLTLLQQRQQQQMDQVLATFDQRSTETAELRRVVIELRQNQLQQATQTANVLAQMQQVRDEVVTTMGQGIVAAQDSNRDVLEAIETLIAGQQRPAPAPSAITPSTRSTMRYRTVGSAATIDAADAAVQSAAAEQNIAFVVDDAGSMTDRLLILNELQRRISDLQPDDRFTVILFGGQKLIEAPPRGLKPADAQHRADALSALQSLQHCVVLDKRPDAMTAIEAAIGYNPDRVVLMSNAALIGTSFRNQVGAFFSSLDQLNGRRSVRIDTIQFFYDDPLRLMQRIASGHGGQYEFIVEVHESTARDQNKVLNIVQETGS